MPLPEKQGVGQFDSASGHKLLNKLKYKIKNKELSKYFIWKLNEFRKSPLTELKLNFYKYNLYNCGDDFKKYLEIKFKILKLKKSDINEHLETLSKYASTTQTILETGVRGVVSSWALIHGLYNNKSSEKSIFLNDIEPCDINEILKISENLNINLEFEWRNNLKLELDRNFDLVFIDTWHVYGQLKRELKKFSAVTNKYIILHDTTLDGDIGETIRLGWDSEQQSRESGYTIEEIEKGLWPAVEEFLDENENWQLEKRFTNCNGLTILKNIEKSI